jgi:hypothetical protein
MMRRLVPLFTMSLVLALMAGNPAMAQTGSPDTAPLNNRAIRKQDREVCTNEAVLKNITRRNQAEFIRTCMAEKQGERRAAAKKNASESRRARRGMAVEEWRAILEVRNRERHEELERQAAKRADCNRQANDQKLRVKERRRFVKNCVAQ